MKKIFLLAFLVFSTGFIYSQVPNPPVLISPPDNSNINVDSVLLDWSDVPGATNYRVQVFQGATTILDIGGLVISQYLIPSSYLTYNTSYYWHANASSPGGTSLWSAYFHFTTVPALPTPPTLISPINGAIGVSIHPLFNWTDVPGATAYILQVSKSPLFDSLVVCDTTPIAPITLQYNTHYYWRVCALNLIGAGNWSSVFNFTTGYTVPDPPTLISPADSSIIPASGQVFDWSDVPTATSYRIQISMSSNFGTIFVNQVTGSNSQYTHNLPAFQNNTMYYWRVNASGPSGTGQWSSVWRVITIGSPPPAPIVYPVNRGKPVYADSATIFDWSHVSTATSYRIHVSTSPSFPIYIINEVVYDTIFIAPPNTFNNYTMYYWRVASINSGGQTWSTVWNFSVGMSPLNPPTLISPLNNAINVSLTPTLDWSDVTGANAYRLQVSTSSAFSSIILNVAGLSNSAYTVPSGILTNCTQYYWRVKTYNTGDSSAWSGIWSFTTICNPGISVISSEIPTEYKLYNNYPNPFNPNTIIRFQIKDLRFVSLKVYDILGREVKTLVNELEKAGIYEVQFSMDGFESGIYFYRLQAGDFTDTKKMLMIK